MRLTDETIRRIKQNKYSIDCVQGVCALSDGNVIANLCDTIEALQQENDIYREDLDDANIQMAYRDKVIEQLQAERNAWKQAAEVAEKLVLDAQTQNGAMEQTIQHWLKNIPHAELVQENIRLQAQVDTLSDTVNMLAPVEIGKECKYIEMLKQAREALDTCRHNKQGLESAIFTKVCEAIIAIDKVVGK